MAERYCLSVLPTAPAERKIADQPYLLWPDADSGYRDPALRAEEVRIVEEACKDEDKAPADYLQRYGAAYVLWDKARQPGWNLGRLGTPLTTVASGSGWTLYAFGTPGK
jgi:hypothetical protein